MITAMQSSRIDTVRELKMAREHIALCLSAICWRGGQHREVSAILTRIEVLMTLLVPNEPALDMKEKNET